MVLLRSFLSISVLGLLTFTTSLPVSAAGNSVLRSLSEAELLEREACQCHPEEQPGHHDDDRKHHHNRPQYHHRHHHHQQGQYGSGNSAPVNSGFGSAQPGRPGSVVSSTPSDSDSSSGDDSSDDDNSSGPSSSSGSYPGSPSGSYPGSSSGSNSGSSSGSSSSSPSSNRPVGGTSATSGAIVPTGIVMPPGMSSYLLSSSISAKLYSSSTASTSLTTISTTVGGQSKPSSTSSASATVSSKTGNTYQVGPSSSLASSSMKPGSASTISTTSKTSLVTSNSVSTTQAAGTSTMSTSATSVLSTSIVEGLSSTLTSSSILTSLTKTDSTTLAISTASTSTTAPTSSKTLSSSIPLTSSTSSGTLTSSIQTTSITLTTSTRSTSATSMTSSIAKASSTLTTSSIVSTSSMTSTSVTKSMPTTLTSSTASTSSTVSTSSTAITSSTSLTSSTTLKSSTALTSSTTSTSVTKTASTTLTSSTASTTSTTLTSVTKTTSATLTTSTSTTLKVTSTISTTTSTNPGSIYTTTVKAVGAQPSGNPIIKPGLNELVMAGKDYTITWEPTTTGKITLLLLRGPAENIQVLYPLAEGYDNTGTFNWKVDSSLEPDTTHYGLQLIVESNGQYQYSTQFGIYNPLYTGKVTASMPTLTSTATTSATPLSTFNPRSNSNLFAWWGQNGKAPLGDFCKDTTYDVIIMSFLNVFKGAGGYPGMNLGTYTHTFAQTPAQAAAGATDLWDAKDVAADIKICQAAGKKVFLSLGGAVAHAEENFATEAEGAAFATMVWNLFLGGSSALRPFGSVVLDGIDINNESWNIVGYASLISGLRSQMDGNAGSAPSGKYWLSGAAWPCDKITNSPNIPYNSFSTFDYITVQFYNSGTAATCNHVSPPTSGSGFSAAVKQWSAAMPGNTMLLVGALAVSQDQFGFLATDDLVIEVGQTRKLGLKNVGGYSLWDATYAQQIGMDKPVKTALING